ncbi:hypothetical protein BCR33DRAFT_96886 [Rhizoclosmatium globosum]|uniref:Nephrocystin 3-like N-terminal domain-containing protein n=1 Tax=Rhizoclosmatium globosum TaxID=329046 RepID=A0A1Y2CK84_9FUNG|nr:hypothetical protein BCR33DRAFT_96886 [Rhizoclosmatium globosum]|eukprot:ORY47422.1 hypothetical protein BCR33DRAFT_96886 [Rhizoclosmatium globosum]
MENTQDRQAIGQGKNIVIKTPIMSFQAAVYAVCCIPFDAFRSITSRASSPTEAEPLLPPNLAISTTDQTSSTILTINQPSPNPALSPRPERTETPKAAPIKYRRPIRNRDLTLKQWLCPVDFKSQMTVFEEDYVPTAQVWIANIVYEWAVLPDDAPIMWINGGGKSGKTYSCYSVVRHLPEELILGCAYFTRYDDLRTTEPESVIRTLVWQLFERLPAFKAYVESIMSQDLAPSNKVSLLEDPVNAFTLLVVNGLNEIPVPEHNVLIVIDALDELSVKTRKVDPKSIYTIVSPKPARLSSQSTTRQNTFNKKT